MSFVEMSAKKSTEKRTLIRFISNKSLRMKLYGIEPMDPPDFKLKRYQREQSKSIGVELTRVINPSLKMHEAAQDTVVEIARTLFRKEYNLQLEVFVEFSTSEFALDPKSIKKLATKLYELVDSVVKNNTGWRFRVESEEINNIQEFHRITIINDTDQNFENWQPFGAFVVPVIDLEWIGNIIKRKEVKIKTYPEAFDEKWLVLATNFGHQSSHFDFGKLKIEFRDSPFDKIYLYKDREDEIIKLK